MKLCLPLIFLFFAVCHPILSGAAEQHHYLRTTGSKTILFDWRLEQDTDLKLITNLGEERDITRMDSDLSTHHWTINDPTAKTTLAVSRHDQELMIDGIFKGKPVQRIVKIDSAPWYQALSLSLRQLTDAEHNHLEFWSIRPDTLDVHRLQVTKEAEEILVIEGGSFATIKLKIQLTGLKSAFWSCHYWLRKQDGLFVRYEGPSGPPGWPMTTVELIGLPQQTRVATLPRIQ